MDDARATKQSVRISERDMNNMFLIRNPEIPEEITVPSNISDVADRLPILLMEAWNQEFTPLDRISLRILLPEGHRDNVAVMSIFSGGTSRFYIDRCGDWIRSVCEGKENPDAVLKRDMDFMTLQSESLKDLELYHKVFLEKAQRYKRLWSDTCKGDDDMFFEIIEKYKCGQKQV